MKWERRSHTFSQGTEISHVINGPVATVLDPGSYVTALYHIPCNTINLLFTKFSELTTQPIKENFSFFKPPEF